jgi:hypothetical protein
MLDAQSLLKNHFAYLSLTHLTQAEQSPFISPQVQPTVRPFPSGSSAPESSRSRYFLSLSLSLSLARARACALSLLLLPSLWVIYRQKRRWHLQNTSRILNARSLIELRHSDVLSRSRARFLLVACIVVRISCTPFLM